MTTTRDAPQRKGQRSAGPKGGGATANGETAASTAPEADAASPPTAASAARQRGSRGARGGAAPAPRGPAPKISNPLNVGEGILVKMAELSDHPIRDAEFFRNADGSQVEQCWGTKGLYIASSASGSWEVAGPFGGGA